MEVKATTDALLDQLKTFLSQRKQVPILVFIEKQDKKQVELIEQVCDDFLIDVDQILAEDHLKRFSETTATEQTKVSS